MTTNQKAPIYGDYLDLTRTIPCGCVMHYKGISDFVGEGIARNVGIHLSKLPQGTNIPWWRVVGKQGRYGILRTRGDRAVEQRELLEAEGVVFDEKGRFAFENYRHYPTPPEVLAA